MVRNPRPEMGTEKEVLSRRVVAAILDVFIILFILGFFMSIGMLSFKASPFFFVVFTFIGIFITFFYAFLMEGFMGQTLGKKLMGIVVVKENGSPCDYLSSFTRNLLRIVDWLPYYYLLGLIVILLSPNSQRIGDYIAGTIVVRVEKY